MTPAQIKAARHALGLTAAQLGALMGIDPPDIYRIEAGTRPPPVRFLPLLQAYLDGYRPQDWPKPAHLTA